MVLTVYIFSSNVLVFLLLDIFAFVRLQLFEDPVGMKWCFIVCICVFLWLLMKSDIFLWTIGHSDFLLWKLFILCFYFWGFSFSEWFLRVHYVFEHPKFWGLQSFTLEQRFDRSKCKHKETFWYFVIVCAFCLVKFSILVRTEKYSLLDVWLFNI